MNVILIVRLLMLFYFVFFVNFKNFENNIEVKKMGVLINLVLWENR